VSNLRACGPLAYIDNDCAKQLLCALDDHVWGMKITALEESADFAILDTEKLFSKLKSHELSRQGHPNHDASFTSKALITNARVGGHDANPTNADSHALEFALSSVATASDEQYESIPDDEIICWQGSSVPCTSSARRGGEHPQPILSAATPLTSSLITPIRRISTPATSTTRPIETTTTTRVTTRRRTASGTTIRR
jgi:hypothetical protein